MRRRLLPALAAALTATLFALPSPANGKFPAAGQIVVDPGDPAHILVRSTFGILVSRDAGHAFDWICESGAGYAGNVDPGIAVTAKGTILAGVAGGLDIGRGDGCGWMLAGGDIQGQAIADVSVLKSQPVSAIALAVSAAGNVVFRSDDDAVTWIPSGVPLPPTFQGITLDAAPSDPQRIYLSGLDESTGVVSALARTSDGGATWDILPIDLAMGRTPYLAAVDPNDPAVVYVRLDGTPGTLLVTQDAGVTWSSVFSIPGYIRAFALSPDGAAVLAGGPTDGLWRAPRTTYAFERVSAIGVQCLSWSGPDVYACSTTFAVGRSTDAGSSFDPLLRLECIRGPLPCDPATSVGATCPGEWPAIQIKIGSMYCANDAGGAGGAGGSGGEGTGGTGSGGSVSPEGCSCRTASAARDVWGLGWMAAAAAFARARRRAGRREEHINAPRTRHTCGSDGTGGRGS